MVARREPQGRAVLCARDRLLRGSSLHSLHFWIHRKGQSFFLDFSDDILLTTFISFQPKGVVHSSAGYLLGAKLTLKYVFDVHEVCTFSSTFLNYVDSLRRTERSIRLHGRRRMDYRSHLHRLRSSRQSVTPSSSPFSILLIRFLPQTESPPPSSSLLPSTRLRLDSGRLSPSTSSLK